MVEALHGCARHPDATANLLLAAARRVDLRTQVGEGLHSLDVMPAHLQTGRFIQRGFKNIKCPKFEQ